MGRTDKRRIHESQEVMSTSYPHLTKVVCPLDLGLFPNFTSDIKRIQGN